MLYYIGLIVGEPPKPPTFTSHKIRQILLVIVFEIVVHHNAHHTNTVIIFPRNYFCLVATKLKIKLLSMSCTVTTQPS